MLDALKKPDPASLKVRERIALAVRVRFELLEPYREAERLAIAYWMRPFRKFEGARAGLENGGCHLGLERRYHRGLQSLYKTRAAIRRFDRAALFWLNDHSAGQRRLGVPSIGDGNVLSVEQLSGRALKQPYLSKSRSVRRVRFPDPKRLPPRDACRVVPVS